MTVLAETTFTIGPWTALFIGAIGGAMARLLLELRGWRKARRASKRPNTLATSRLTAAAHRVGESQKPWTPPDDERKNQDG